MPRHGSEDVYVNEEEFYEELFNIRDVPKITHYRTAVWPPVTKELIKQFSNQRHTWKLGDKYYKLASQYYGSPKMWWVIAWYNQKPTEAHAKIGDTIYIPFPINRLLTYFNFGSM
jgi:hypothetical protein